MTEDPYHVEAIEVSGVGTYHVDSEQYFDGFLFLYGGSFDPADPSARPTACPAPMLTP